MINLRVLKNPASVLTALGKRGCLRWMSDERYIKLIYRYRFGRFPDLSQPMTFNEKLQWLKLHYRKPHMVMEADKLAVKEYVKEVLGPEYVIPTIGFWKKAEDIDVHSLPEKFVLKCNHDSGGVVICRDRDKFDFRTASQKLNRCLKRNAYWYGREWPYKDIKPVILAENYLEDRDGAGELTDYKMSFFGGECQVIAVIRHRHSKEGMEADFYSPVWEHLNYARSALKNNEYIVPKPDQLQDMLRCGKILAKDYPYVRIDFYISGGKLYFGEITFYPTSGFRPFKPAEIDSIWGSWLRLPEADSVRDN